MRNTTPYLVGFSLLVSGLFVGACGGDAEGVDSDGDTTEVEDAPVTCDAVATSWDRYQFHLVSSGGAPLDSFDGTLSFRHAEAQHRTTLYCPPPSVPYNYRCERAETVTSSMPDGAGTVNYLAEQRAGDVLEVKVEASNGEGFEGELAFVEGVVPGPPPLGGCYAVERVFDVTIQLEAAP